MWPLVAVFVISVIASYALMPKPPAAQGPSKAGFGDLKVPTAEEGREIPVLFGTRDIESPNVVWYGDFKSKAIKETP